MIGVQSEGANFKLVLVPGSPKGPVDDWATEDGEATASYFFVVTRPRGTSLGREFCEKLAAALNALGTVCWFTEVVSAVNDAIQQEYPGVELGGVAED